MNKLYYSVVLLSIITVFLSAQGKDESFNPDLDFAQVVYVNAFETSGGVWRFDVTLLHNDEGWNHYATSWQVVNPETMEILSERVLAHPHVEEQPFTRSQGNIKIPSALTKVLVRAKCQRHGFGGQEITVPLVSGETSLYKVTVPR